MVLIKYLKANRSTPLFTLACQGGFLVMGVVMVAIINTFLNDEPNYACMGSFFMLMGAVVGILARGNTAGATRFHLAVGMGHTRRSYILCDVLINLLNGALGVTTTFLAYQVESWAYAAIWPTYENDMPLDALFQPKWIALLLVSMAALDLILGAFNLRFGNKAFLTVWFTLCFGCMIVPRAVEAYAEGGASLFAKLGGAIMVAVGALSVQIWVALGVAVVLGLLAFAVSVFSRAEVKM